MQSKGFKSIITLAALAFAASAQAASYTVLHHFSGTDGSQPTGRLTLDSEGNIFGTTNRGGRLASGTLFKYNGATLTTLHHFSNGLDGGYPFGALIADDDGNLYGTTMSGGAGGHGTVFRWDRELGHRVLKNFAGNKDGSTPHSGVTRDADGTLYGTTFYGGDMTCASFGCGTIFKISPTGLFTQLYAFPAGASGNADNGYGPNATLYRVKNRLFGSTVYGLPWAGSPFSIGVDGTGFTTTTLPTVSYNFMGGLVRDRSGNLWGVTMREGTGYGGIYKISPTGVYTLVFSVSGANGAYPTGTLVMDARGALYGTTKGNGTWSSEGSGEGGYGTVFKYDPATNVLTTLHTFTGLDGKNPFAGLVRDPAGNLYGVAQHGGKRNHGVIFRVTP